MQKGLKYLSGEKQKQGFHADARNVKVGHIGIQN